MQSKLLHGLKLALSVALLAGIIFHLYKHKEVLSSLLDFSLPWSLALFLAHFLNYVFLGKAQAVGLGALGVRLTPREWFGLSVIAELFNYVLPAKGGTAVRFMYLNQRHKVGLADFVVMMTTYTFMALSVLGALGLIFNLTMIASQDQLHLIVNGLLFLLLLSAPVFVFSFDLIKKLTKLAALLSPAHFLRERPTLLKALGLYMAIFVLYPFKTAFAFYVVGIDVPLPQMLEISLVLLVVSLFPVLPGNLGLKELATAYLAQRMGLSFDQALVASLVDRTILSLLIIPAGLTSYVDLFWKGGHRSARPVEAHLPVSLAGNG